MAPKVGKYHLAVRTETLSPYVMLIVYERRQIVYKSSFFCPFIALLSDPIIVPRLRPARPMRYWHNVRNCATLASSARFRHEFQAHAGSNEILKFRKLHRHSPGPPLWSVQQ